MTRKLHPNVVRVVCAKPGCPRTAYNLRDRWMSLQVSVVETFCPWHVPEGCKDIGETYYDSQGKQLDFLQAWDEKRWKGGQP